MKNATICQFVTACKPQGYTAVRFERTRPENPAAKCPTIQQEAEYQKPQQSEVSDCQERKEEYFLAAGGPPLPWNSETRSRDPVRRARDRSVCRSSVRFEAPCSLTTCSELLTLAENKLFTTPPIIHSGWNATISLALYHGTTISMVVYDGTPAMI